MSSDNEFPLISDLLAIILSLIFTKELTLQLSIIIEFSKLVTEIIELLPTLTLGPIEEFATISQLSPIITGPSILHLYQSYNSFQLSLY